MRKRGTLRVGYNKDNLPFSFFNSQKELVGFDVELIHQMALDLGVTVEFIPWNYQTAMQLIEQKAFVIGIGGLTVTPERLTRIDFSIPYINLTAGIVVEDYRRHDFASWQEIDKEMTVRLGIVGKSRVAEVEA